MASLWVTITPDPNDGTKATVSGEFSGGDESYAYARRIRVSITGVGDYYFTSPQTSGGYNTFSGVITGLSPGTFYSWFAWLQYRVTGGFGGDSFEQNGNFTTASVSPPQPTQTYYAYINFNATGGSGAPATQYGNESNNNGYVNFYLPSTVPVKNGFVFAGWTLNSDGSGTLYAAGSKIVLYSGATSYPGTGYTLYAVWVEDTSSGILISTGGGYLPGDVWLYADQWRLGDIWICLGGTTWKRGG